MSGCSGQRPQGGHARVHLTHSLSSAMPDSVATASSLLTLLVVIIDGELNELNVKVIAKAGLEAGIVSDCEVSDIAIMKDSNTTDLTVGCYAGLKAYLCNDLDIKSIELAICNYNKQSGPFSAKGDSGLLIFNGKGHIVSVLHMMV
jgi:hypothetical protein